MPGMENKYELEHIGINTGSAGEAERLAALLSGLFGLVPRKGKKSEFAGDYFECMGQPGPGAHGHIAMRTKDLDAAVEELKGRGIAFDMDTASYNGAGQLTNIYLAGEFAGFAIHIMKK